MKDVEIMETYTTTITKVKENKAKDTSSYIAYIL
jgi:hypothetical protein